MNLSRPKKQLTIADNVESLTDQELREALKSYHQSPGPITDSTRNLYRKKLASLMGETPANNNYQNADDDDDDEDTSDEDFDIDDEEEDESVSEEDEESYDDEDEDDIEEELSDIKKAGNITNNTSIMLKGESSANRISRTILTLVASFFVGIFSLYFFSIYNNNLFANSQPLKNVTKQLLILVALSPIGYTIYRVIGFFRLRRHEEMKKVCKMVNEALELLQSPDNPGGMMPILHIRDTLLTPTERKARHLTNLWDKAVKFVEENESRVKVEMVNVDGEDFRAWKWIGSRKL